jgi:hypothetical protein
LAVLVKSFLLMLVAFLSMYGLLVEYKLLHSVKLSSDLELEEASGASKDELATRSTRFPSLEAQEKNKKKQMKVEYQDLEEDLPLLSSTRPIMQAKEGHESVSKLGWMQSSTSTADAKVHTSGLDLHPEHLKGKCVAVRLRGSNATLSVDDAIECMKAERYNRGGGGEGTSTAQFYQLVSCSWTE